MAEKKRVFRAVMELPEDKQVTPQKNTKRRFSEFY
jgi:hypothetical protein